MVVTGGCQAQVAYVGHPRPLWRDATCEPANESSDLENGLREDEVSRAKLKAYEAALRERLAGWNGLKEATVECYRSRIEELGPKLENAIEQRCTAADPIPEASMKPGQVDPEPKVTEELWSIATTQEHTLQSVDIESVDVSVSGTRNSNAAEVGSSGKVLDRGLQQPSMKAVPWRTNTSSRRRAPLSGDMKDKLEEEMTQLTMGLKGAAGSVLTSLKEQNQRLEQISDTTQRNYDKITAETQKGKQMMRSGQLGFLCTMIMLATSVIIFFMMIPFIIIT